MLLGKKVVIVLPAFNAEDTLEVTVRQIPEGIADEILLVDDSSSDRTVEVARALGVRVIVHDRNRGYGGEPEDLLPRSPRARCRHRRHAASRLPVRAEAGPGHGRHDCLGGLRRRARLAHSGRHGASGGMPRYKYVSNRALTASQNLMLGTKLSEFHTGYRAFSREVLTTLPLLATRTTSSSTTRCWRRRWRSASRSARSRARRSHFPEASSISFSRSVRYGIGVVATSVEFVVWRWGLVAPARYSDSPALTVLAAREAKDPGDAQLAMME